MLTFLNSVLVLLVFIVGAVVGVVCQDSYVQGVKAELLKVKAAEERATSAERVRILNCYIESVRPKPKQKFSDCVYPE